MLNSNTKDAEDLRIYQIIDANLDRARERTKSIRGLG